MPFKPGNISNPAGRPPKARALASAISEAMDLNIRVGGRWMTKQRYLGMMLAELLTTGQTKFYDPDTKQRTTVLTLGPREWIDMVKFVATHTDGPVHADTVINIDNRKAYIGFAPDAWDNDDQSFVQGEVVEDTTPAQIPATTTPHKPTRKAKAVKRGK